MLNEMMEVTKNAQVTVPMPQLLLLLATLSFCLLFRYARLGLLAAYAYTFHLGLMYCDNDLASKGPPYDTFVVVYIVFGAILLLLGAIGMLWHRSE